jgi:hypothetical protein
VTKWGQATTAIDAQSSVNQHSTRQVITAAFLRLCLLISRLSWFQPRLADLTPATLRKQINMPTSKIASLGFSENPNEYLKRAWINTICNVTHADQQVILVLYGHYFIWQISVFTSFRLSHPINLVHSRPPIRPHTQRRKVINDICEIKYVMVKYISTL